MCLSLKLSVKVSRSTDRQNDMDLNSIKHGFFQPETADPSTDFERQRRG